MPQKGDRGKLADGSLVEFDGVGWLPLAQQEAAPTEPPGVLRGLLSTLGEVGTGAAKGAGQTATNLGQAVSAIPGIGDVTRGLGNIIGGAAGQYLYGTRAEPAQTGMAFSEANKQLEPTTTGEKVGKVGEQIAEFMLPGSKLGTAERLPSIARTLVGEAAPHVPASAWPYISPVLKAAGEGVQAAGIGALHGDQNVDAQAKAAAGSTLGGEALAELTPLLLKNPTLIHVLPVFLAATVGGGLGFGAGGIGGAGLGAGLGMFGAKRSIAKDFVDWMAANPDKVKVALQTAGPRLGQIGAGSISEWNAPRRRPLPSPSGP